MSNRITAKIGQRTPIYPSLSSSLLPFSPPIHPYIHPYPQYPVYRFYSHFTTNIFYSEMKKYFLVWDLLQDGVVYLSRYLFSLL